MAQEIAGRKTLMVRREVQGVIYDEVDNARTVLIIKKTDYSARCYRWRLVKGGLHDGEAETEGAKTGNS